MRDDAERLRDILKAFWRLACHLGPIQAQLTPRQATTQSSWRLRRTEQLPLGWEFHLRCRRKTNDERRRAKVNSLRLSSIVFRHIL